MATPCIGDVLAEQLVRAGQQTEAELDAELQRLDALKDDDLEELRRKRLEQMQSNHSKKQEMLARGHGEYTMLDEKEFFAVAKESNLLVIHFWRPSTWRCEIVDKHLQVLCKKHWKTRFVKVNAEKSPFLTERMHIWCIPSLVLCKDGKTDHTIVGFTELGATDEFPTERLEEILAFHEVISLD